MGKYVKKLFALVLVSLLIFSSSLPAFASRIEENIPLGNSNSPLKTEERGSPSGLSDSMTLIDENFEADTMEELSISFIKNKSQVQLSLKSDPENNNNHVLQMETTDGGFFVDTDEEWSNYIFECRIYIEEFNSSADWMNIAPVWYVARAETTNWNKYAVKYRNKSNQHTLYKRYAASDTDISSKPADADFIGKWHDYKIVANNGKFQVNLDGEELFSFTDSSLKSGTIGVDSAIIGGNCKVLVDDIKVTRQATGEPSADKASGSYAESFLVTLTPGSAGDEIYYTLDNKDPIEHGIKYVEPINIMTDTTLKIVATASGKTYSSVVTYDYILTSLSAPAIEPRGGIYKDSVTVSMQTVTVGSEIYYTLDESVPTKDTGIKYTQPLTITENTVVKAITVKSGYPNSAVVSMAYEITDQDINSFYVAKNGSDTNTGKQDAPFATIEKARDAARQVSGNMTGDITVYVAEGEYYFNNTLEFSALDSGTNGFKIRYVSVDGEGKARIIGGKDVSGTGWTLSTDSDVGYDLRPELKDKVYKIDLSADTVDFNTLYVDGDRATLARVQNYEHDERFPMQMGPYMRTAGGGIWDIVYKQGDLDAHSIAGMVNAQARGDEEIAQVTGWDGSGWNWMTSTIPLKAINESNRRLDFFKDDSDSGMYRAKYTMGGGARYFLQGNLAFLDTQGEFFYSKERKTLYYYPLDGQNVATAEIIAPQLETLISIKGEDKDNVGDIPDPEKQVHGIVLDGFSIEGTNFPSYYSYGWNSYDAKGAIGYYPPEAHEEGITLPTYCEQAERPQFQVGGIVMRDTHDITIKNSKFSNIGMTGIVMWQDNENNTVENCEIKETGYCAILLDGGYPGVGNFNGYHSFNNLMIHKTGELVGHAASVTLLRSGNNNFSHSEIYNSPRRGIFMGEWRPRYNGPGTPNDSGYDPYRDIVTFNNNFEYMYLHDLQHDGGDDGAIFIAGLYDGRNGAEKHKQNYFNQVVVDKVGANANMLDIRPNGINLDMGASGTTLTDVMIVNAHQYNFRYDNDYRDVYYFDNINSWYGDNDRLDKTFDLSRMEFDQIGVTGDYSFSIPNRPSKDYNDVYFREEFDEGLANWWNLAGKPATSSVYFSQNGEMSGYSFMADSYYNKTEKCLIGKPLGHDLNKVVEIDFFDHTRVRNSVYHLTFQSALDSFARVDDGKYQRAIGVDTSFDSAHYTYKIGSLARSTDVVRTYGWHTFKWDYTSGTEVKMYIDDELIASVPAKHFNYIEMGDYGAGGYNAYDNVVVYEGDSALPPIILPEPPEIVEPEKNKYLPGKIEAEEPNSWPGSTRKESITGGTAVAYIGVGDIFEYDVTVKEDIVDSKINVRHATNGSIPGQVKISFNDDANTSTVVSLPGTGGWTTYSASEAIETLSLPAGEYTMLVEIVKGNINLDWFSFTLEDTTVIPVEDVKLQVDTSKPIKISLGDSLVLPYKISPQNASNTNVTWSKEDLGGIISLEANGKITGLQAGQATVVLTSDSNITLNSKVIIQVEDTQAGLISTTAKGVVATVSTSWDNRYTAVNLIDGNLGTEWVSNQLSPPVTDANPTANLTWATPQTVSTIYAYDRVNNHDFTQVVDITIKYSDGSQDEILELTGLSNDGKTPGILSFDTPKNNVKTILFAIDRAKNPSTDDKGALGFSELKVFGVPPIEVPVHSIVFEKDSINLFKGMDVRLEIPSIVPSTATNLSYNMTLIPDTGIISLEEHRVDGVLRYYTIKALAEGQATLRAETTNGMYAELVVMVGAQGDLADTILVAEELYYNTPGNGEAHKAFKEAIDEVIVIFNSSLSPNEHQAANDKLKNAIIDFQNALGAVGKTAQEVAGEIQLSSPTEIQMRLNFPEAPFGFDFTITTTPASVISKNGYIIRPEKDTNVKVEFIVHKLSDNTTAIRTIEIMVTGSLTKHTIQVSSNLQNGTIVFKANGKSVSSAQKGTIITIEATPNANYRLQKNSITAGTTPIDATNSFVMPDAPIVVSAVFERIYKVTVNNLVNGTVTADKSQAAKGETVKLTVTPNSGYKLVEGSLSVNSIVVKNQSFTMAAEDAVVKALFEKTDIKPNPDPDPKPEPKPDPKPVITPPSSSGGASNNSRPESPDNSPNAIPGRLEKEKAEVPPKALQPPAKEEPAVKTPIPPATSGGGALSNEATGPKEESAEEKQSTTETETIKPSENVSKEEPTKEIVESEQIPAVEATQQTDETQQEINTTKEEPEEKQGLPTAAIVAIVAAGAILAAAAVWFIRFRKPR